MKKGLLLLLLLIVLQTLAVADLPEIPANVIPGLTAGILKYTNQHRVDIGVPVLTEDPKADHSALWFSQEMAQTGNYNHDHMTADGTPFEKRINSFSVCGDPCGFSAENIHENSANYVGQPSSIAALLTELRTDAEIDAMANSIVKDWIASPGHKRNMEDPLMELIGVGVAISPTGVVYATQDFFRKELLTPDQSAAEDASVAAAKAAEKPQTNPSN
jgi:uncharacterized protein YkwD